MSVAVEKSENCACACCGIAGVDDIKLKDCDDCDLVKYCSDECQEDHRPKHEEECKKRDFIQAALKAWVEVIITSRFLLDYILLSRRYLV